MRLSHSFVGFVTAVGLAACGGSKTPHVIIDADSTDAPPDAFTCIFKNPGMFNPTAPLDFSTGTGQSQGKVGTMSMQLQTGANVTFTDTNGTADGTGFGIFMTNRSGVFADAEAGIFEKPPTPGTYPMDEDDKIGFGIDFFDGVSATSIDPTQVYLLDSTMGTPTVTIDTFTPKAQPGMHTKIGATFKTATFAGFTVDGDNLTEDGCLITIVNFQFTNLDVLWQTEPFPASLAPVAPLPPVVTKTPDGKLKFNRDAWHARHDQNTIRIQRP